MPFSPAASLREPESTNAATAAESKPGRLAVTTRRPFGSVVSWITMPRLSSMCRCGAAPRSRRRGDRGAGRGDRQPGACFQGGAARSLADQPRRFAASGERARTDRRRSAVSAANEGNPPEAAQSDRQFPGSADVLPAPCNYQWFRATWGVRSVALKRRERSLQEFDGIGLLRGSRV